MSNDETNAGPSQEKSPRPRKRRWKYLGLVSMGLIFIVFGLCVGFSHVIPQRYRAIAVTPEQGWQAGFTVMAFGVLALALAAFDAWRSRGQIEETDEGDS